MSDDPLWRDVEIARDGIDDFAGDGTDEMAAFERLVADRAHLQAENARLREVLQEAEVVLTAMLDGEWPIERLAARLSRLQTIARALGEEP